MKNEQEIRDAVCISKTFTEACIILKTPGAIANLKRYIKKYNIDASHFTQVRKGKEERICPICQKQFYVWESEKKITCSYKCANKFFRSGEDNGNHKRGNGLHPNSSYRYICFKHHAKQCIICKEQNIVEVHHFDNDNSNNTPNNLIPLCPTHHKYMHSSFRYLIIEDIEKYRDNFNGM